MNFYIMPVFMSINIKINNEPVLCINHCSGVNAAMLDPVMCLLKNYIPLKTHMIWFI